MEKEEFRSSFLFNKDGKVNSVLLFCLVLIFVLSAFFVEAVLINPVSPTNFSINGSRNINFTFRVNWSMAGEFITNCSIWTNITGTLAETKANSSTNGIFNDSGVSGGNLSHINFTLAQDGLFNWSVACANGTSGDGGPLADWTNFSVNRSLLVDATPPRLFAITPNTSLAANQPTNFASGNFTTWPIFYVNVSDNSTHTVWYILNGSYTTQAEWTAGTSIGQLENSTGKLNNVTMSRDRGAGVNVMERYNATISLNFSSAWRGPGAHSVVFCANDTVGNKNCIGSYDFVILGVNVTQMELTLVNFGQSGALGLNITYGNGTEVPAGDSDSGGAPPSAGYFNPLAQNYTFVFNMSRTNKLYLVGLSIDEGQLGNASNANITTMPEKEVLSAVGYGFNTTMVGGDFSRFIPDFVRYKFGVIELTGVGFNRRLYCSGASIASPNCTAVLSCNATAFGVNNDSNVLNTILGAGSASACYLEGDKGELNGVSLTAGRTYLFVKHFSQGALGNDSGAPEIQFFGSLVNNETRTRHETPPFDAVIFNTTSTFVVINFTVTDINSTGINMSVNNSINVTVRDNGISLSAGTFYVSGVSSNLTCVPNGHVTNSSVYNITGLDISGNLTDGVNCTLTVTGLSNGTKNITVQAKDASNNSNINITSVLMTVDQIPPKFSYYNITHNVTIDPTTDSADNLPLNASDFRSSAQGKKIYIVANWSDNLTQVWKGTFQFYNASTSSWQTLNTSPSNYIAGHNSSWTNFTFGVPIGQNEFEGRNVSFRIIANDTLGNVNNSAYAQNFTVLINDTSKPKIVINGTALANGSNLSSTTFLASWYIIDGNQISHINVSIDGVDQASETATGCVKFKQFAGVPDSGNPNDPNSNTNKNSSFSLSTDTNCPLTNGSHFIRVAARDMRNNTEVVFHNFTLQSGGSPRLIVENFTRGTTLWSKNSSTINNTNITSAVGITLSGSALTGVSVANISYVSNCNSSASTVTIGNGNITVYPFNESTCPTQSENRTLTVTVTDTAGNTNTTVFTFLVDNVGPTFAVWSPTNQQTFTQTNTSLNFSILDDDQAISFYGYYLDNNDNVLYTLNISATIGAAGRNISESRLVNHTGTHTIKFTANDTLGNIANTSWIAFIQIGAVNLTRLNDSLITNLGSNNVSNISFFDGSGNKLEGMQDVNQTLQLFLELNRTQRKANVTINFNGSLANWNMTNEIFILMNDSTLGTDIFNNETAIVIDSILANSSSFSKFLVDNNSYFVKVSMPLNATNNSPGRDVELWYYSNEKDLSTKVNVTQCSVGLSPTQSMALSAGSFPCWNNTDNKTVAIYLPHFSAVALVNNSEAPWVNVTTPNSANQSVSMFVPNISVSGDVVTCVYSVNGTIANVTMTKSGNICLGQTERFKNLNALNGNYNLTITLTDSGSNVETYFWKFNVSDSASPNSPNSSRISSSVTSTTATITVSGINESVNVTMIYSTSINSLSSIAMETDFNQSQSVALTGLTADRSYYYNLTVCDYNGNCATNGTFNFTTDVASSTTTTTTTTDSGGGGGAATPAATISDSKSQIWGVVSKDSSISMSINKATIAITSVAVNNVKSELKNVNLEVQSLKDKPVSKVAAAKVYQYLNVEKKNLADEDATSIKVAFRVTKSWLTANGLASSDVVLYRYKDGTWNKLATKIISDSDANYINYEAETPGLSYFAIGSKAAASAELQAILDMIDSFYAKGTPTLIQILDAIDAYYLSGGG
ncbi:PGF-pre-PGF domain-containing protein [Candidatus Woesearchaeota archaeon]|nr:PGF-pre-PGF domain-containing protein [Candidatus Woesearchaeota archaeon]